MSGSAGAAGGTSHSRWIQFRLPPPAFRRCRYSADGAQGQQGPPKRHRGSSADGAQYANLLRPPAGRGGGGYKRFGGGGGRRKGGGGGGRFGGYKPNKPGRAW